MPRYTTDEDRAEIVAALSETDDDSSTPEAPDEGEPEQPDEGDVEVTEPDGEQAEQPDEQPQEPEQTYAVKVGGQELQVPVSELVKGYQRTADYTRKTQQLASERRQLETADQLLRALDANPHATLAALAEHYQVDPSMLDEAPPGPTPEQLRLAELEQWRQEQFAEQQSAAVDAEIGRLHHEYGDFDDEDLFGFAVAHDMRNLEMALRAMRYSPRPNPQIEKRKVAAMAGGQGRNGAVQPKTDPVEIRSFKDAYEAAKRDLTNNGS